jgi:hypothetical protein
MLGLLMLTLSILEYSPMAEPNSGPLNGPIVVGPRDRVIISVMTYAVARVGAVGALAVEGMLSRTTRLWN